MKTNIFPASMSRTLNRAIFGLKKHSPEILVIAGVTGVVVSAVMACKATTKVETIVKKTKEDVDVIHKAMEEKQINGEEYTEEDGKKDLTIVYAQTGLKLAKLYAPSVVLGALSITSILVSHNMLHKRNLALAAAYATVDTTFKDYRKRVVERFGKELDRELRYNLKSKEVEEIVVDENGEQTVVKKTVQVADEINAYSDYARFFDETCNGWVKNAEYNMMFLNQVQNEMNDLLRLRGHVFLNEVYDKLGIPRSEAGQSVGWFYDEKNPVGDNYIDFGIYNVHRERNRAFVNGYERSILLDFNVDGNILRYFK